MSPEKPYRDEREQRVQPPAPVSNPYRATPESIAYAKQKAAEERAEVDAQIRSFLRQRAKATLVTLVEAHGALLVRTLLDEIEAER